jgi:hypothetical protein
MAPRHAHELEAAGDPRWKAKFDKGLLMVTDLASEETKQAVAYTQDGGEIRFVLEGDSGPRVLKADQPGFEEFSKVLSPPEKAPEKAASASKTDK